MFYYIDTISTHALVGRFLVMTGYYFLVMSKHVLKVSVFNLILDIHMNFNVMVNGQF